MKTSKINLYNIDCMEFMADKPENYYDFVLTDPPYNVKYNYNEYKDDVPEVEYKKWCSSWFNELKRVCGGAIIISPGLVNLGIWYEIEKPKWLLAWLKPAAMGRSAIGFCNWEPMLFYGKPRKQSVDVFKAPIVPDEKMNFHSCPKPVKWAESILHYYAKEGDKCLDIFSGSGTSAIAAHNLGFSIDCLEIDRYYFEKAKKRLSQHQAQTRLF